MSRYNIEKFDPAPDPDLVCCICQCVLDKAVECPCRHVFCQICIETWLTNRHNCPICRTKTKKQDLKPVLPLVQNMLNRLLMICEYREFGCQESIVLENFERHVKNCGYEKRMCRFSKCQKSILKMHLEEHENVVCEHREVLCTGECGLMVALSDQPNHNCVLALKENIEEKNNMIETLKAKLQDLNNLSQSLNDQLEQLRQQLNDGLPRYFDDDVDVSTSSFDSNDEELIGEMDIETSNDSLSLTVENRSDNDADVNDDNDGAADNETNGETGAGGDGADVVEQVERTVVNSLFELSSRLEIVRNQMRAVLNSGHVDDQNRLNDEVRIPAVTLDALVNTNRTDNQTTSREESNGDTNEDNDNNNEDNQSEQDETDYEYSTSTPISYSAPGSPVQTPINYSPCLSVSYSPRSPGHYSPRSSVGYSPRSSMNFSPNPSMDYNDRSPSRHSEHNDDEVGQREQHHVVLTQPPDSPSNTSVSGSDHSSEAYDSNNDLSSIPTIASPNRDDSDELHLCFDRSPNSPPVSGRLPTFCTNDPYEITRRPYWLSPSPSPNHGNGYESSSNHSNHSFSYTSVNSHSNGSRSHDSDGSDSDQNCSPRSPFSDRESNYESRNTGVDQHSDAEVDDHTNLANHESNEHHSPSHSAYNSDGLANTSLSDHVASSPTHYKTSGKEQHNGQTLPYQGRNSEVYSNNGQSKGEIGKQDARTETSQTGPSSPGAGTSGVKGAAQGDGVSRCEPDSTQEPSVVPPRHSTSGSASSTPVNYDRFTESSDSDGSDSMKYITKRLRKDSRRVNSKRHAGNNSSREHEVRINDEGQFNERGRNKSGPDRRKRKADFNVASVSSGESKRRKCDDQSNKTSIQSNPAESKSRPHSYRSDSSHKRSTVISCKRTSTIQSDSHTQEPNGQSLNVKIDLSLINYSGPLPTDTSNHSGAGVLRSASISSYNGNSRQVRQSHKNSNVNAGESHASQSTNQASQIYNFRHCSNSATKSSNPNSSSKSLNPSSTSNKAHTVALNNYTNDTEPCASEDDSSSDESWQPGSNPESDISISEEEWDTDSSYEVQVPKSTVDLLNEYEYASDSSDPTWTLEMQ